MSQEITIKIHKIGYLYDEAYMWHEPGYVSNLPYVQPFRHWEHTETKRRFHSLLVRSGLFHHLLQTQPRKAVEEDLLRFHTKEYITTIQQKSQEQGTFSLEEDVQFSTGIYDIAILAVGGVLQMLDDIMHDIYKMGYALIRPPGHHATATQAMGFCIFNNIVLGAKFLQDKYSIKKIAIIDYDVHHGNGTQEAFYNDPSVLYISVHQDSNYPLHSGKIEDIGMDQGKWHTINIPLPPGSGHGAYLYAFQQIILPALENFQPEFLLVSSGYDASYQDPLGAMILSSDSFREFAHLLLHQAKYQHILFLHEGGYSEVYVPFCGLAVMEELLQLKSSVNDPFLNEVEHWGYQTLQPHQKELIDHIVTYHNHFQYL